MIILKYLISYEWFVGAGIDGGPSVHRVQVIWKVIYIFDEIIINDFSVFLNISA